MENLEQLVQNAIDAVSAADEISVLDQVRVDYLGKKGQITQLLKSLGKIDAKDRPAAGAKINEAKQGVLEKLLAKKETLETAALNEKLQSEALDVTLPGRSAEVLSLIHICRCRRRLRCRSRWSPYH